MHTLTLLTLTLGVSTTSLARIDHGRSRFNRRNHHELAARAPFAHAAGSNHDPTGSFLLARAEHEHDLDKRDDVTFADVASVLKLALAPVANASPVQAATSEPSARELADKAAAAKAREAKAAKALAARVKAQKAARAKKAAEAKAKAVAEAKAEAAAKKQAEEEKKAAKAAAKAKAEEAQKAAAEKAAKQAGEAKQAEQDQKTKEQKKANAQVDANNDDSNEDASNQDTKVSVKVKSSSKKGWGLIGFESDNCGPSQATEDDPNGSESWLNCGISTEDKSSGWTPPEGVRLEHLATVSIESALANNPIWEPCRQFTKLFEDVAEKTNLPPILLMSIALQESTCQPNTLGDGGGAFGLMQITQDKCGGRNADGCSEPSYNVLTGAQYLRSEIDNQGGNFLVAMGGYNGWYPGLTYNGATAARSSNCVTQNNLDYLYQLLNGWLLGKTGYTMGSIKNLDACGGDW